MLKTLRVALVTDYMTDLGGSDRLLLSILKVFPQADIYTSIFEKQKYPHLKNKVYTTFLQAFIFRKLLRRVVSILTPLAFESLNLMNDYDLVISLSAGASKGVITSTKQKHISILLTPPRHLWDLETNVRASRFKDVIHFFSNTLSTYMRIWDQTAVKRIDDIITISKYIKDKVKKVYKRDSKVIYPGISSFWYEKNKEELTQEYKAIKNKYSIPDNFFLVVSRLYDYKRVDWAIRSCLINNKTLVIVGAGPDLPYLKSLANGQSNIKFLGKLDDNSLRVLYNNAQALLFCGVEDYGFVPIEAMACGCPVLAFNEGGVTETVVNNKTGYLFSSLEELSEIVKKDVWEAYNKRDCIERSKLFTEEKFLDTFTKYLNTTYEKE
ncbi:MAG TPA: glycosyltransferase [Candidatus Dojkabacteria bacterium]|nr:glycosyltransferase [Candidatus Dojkabacteria bacterium]